MKTLQWIDLGLMDFEKALKIQKDFHRKCIEGTSSGVFIKVEHPDVITLGKNSTKDDLKNTEEFFREQGIPIVQIERGGKMTAHMPGQLVVYPILKILDFNLFPRDFVTFLESSIIELLASFGIVAKSEKRFPGVWVNDEKVCALGIRIEERVSYHGLALNINNKLEIYSQISPCGIEGRGITTISRILDRRVEVAEVAVRLKKIFERRLGVFLQESRSDTIEA